MAKCIGTAVPNSEQAAKPSEELHKYSGLRAWLHHFPNTWWQEEGLVSSTPCPPILFSMHNTQKSDNEATLSAPSSVLEINRRRHL